TFGPQRPFATLSSPSFVATADFDGDGRPDLVVAGTDSSAAILPGNGDGTFRAPQGFAAGPFAAPVAAEVNGDKLPDLLVANRASNSVSVLPGQANGRFGPPQTLAVGQAPVFVTAADVGNGHPDLLVA